MDRCFGLGLTICANFGVCPFGKGDGGLSTARSLDTKGDNIDGDEDVEVKLGLERGLVDADVRNNTGKDDVDACGDEGRCYMVRYMLESRLLVLEQLHLQIMRVASCIWNSGTE